MPAFLVAAIAGFLASKVVRIGVLVAFGVALLGTFWVGVNALLSGIASFFSTDGLWYNFWMGVTFLIPSNFTGCITIMFSADVMVFLYRFYLRMLQVGATA
jgi:hypothetical protein